MELRQYWRILWRRWWLIAIVLLTVLVVSMSTYRAPAPVYSVGMRFSVGIEGVEPVSAASGEGRSDAWLASEYLADDLSEVLKGSAFAREINQQFEHPVAVWTISASREHRIMSVSIASGDPDTAEAVARKVEAAVVDGGEAYFPQLKGVNASAILIDGPNTSRAGRSLKDKLDLPIRLLVALVGGAALAFLWDYLDDTVRDRAELETLGLDVLGEIPRRSRLRRWVKGPRS